MVCSQAAQASYSGRIAPPGRPNTSVTPSASSERMMASAPVIRRGLSTGGHLTVRVSFELRAAAGVVRQRLADRLADLPGGVRAAARDLVGGGAAGGLHLVDGGRDRTP